MVLQLNEEEGATLSFCHPFHCIYSWSEFCILSHLFLKAEGTLPAETKERDKKCLILTKRDRTL